MNHLSRWVVAVCLAGVGCGSSSAGQGGTSGDAKRVDSNVSGRSSDASKTEDDAEREVTAGKPAGPVATDQAGVALAGMAGVGASGSGGSLAAQGGTKGDAHAGSSPARAGEGGGGASDGCMAGYRKSGDKCVCDLNGTFVLRQKIEAGLAVPGSTAVLVSTTGWSIVRGMADADGRLAFAITSCGQEGPDTCAASSSLLTSQAEAYAQYVPAKVWDKLMPTSVEMKLQDALPGAELTTPDITSLLGMELQDATGPWPGSAKDVDGSSAFAGRAVNGARWADDDGDGQPGLTTYMVPPGGVAASDPNGAYSDYPAVSTQCSASGAGMFAYAYPPVLDGAKVVRVKRIYGAQRFVVQLRGKLDSCDRISGQLRGPNGGEVRGDSMVAGCVIVDQDGEAPCPASLIDAMSGVGAAGMPQGLTYTGTFSMKRVGSDTTCRQARSEQFD